MATEVHNQPRAAPERVYVLLLPGVHALDFAGPVQSIFEAAGFGAGYRLRYVSPWRSRVFRQATGITLKTFQHKVKLEVARQLLGTSLGIGQTACECGFEDARQLRRLWRNQFGRSLRDSRPRPVAL